MGQDTESPSQTLEELIHPFLFSVEGGVSASFIMWEAQDTVV